MTRTKMFLFAVTLFAALLSGCGGNTTTGGCTSCPPPTPSPTPPPPPPSAPTIASVTDEIFCKTDLACTSISLTFNGSNYKVGLTLKVDDLADKTMQAADVVSSVKIVTTITIDTPHGAAKNRNVRLCDGTICSTAAVLHFMGNLTTSVSAPAAIPTAPNKLVYLSQGDPAGVGGGTLFLLSTPAGAETPLTQTNALTGFGFGYGLAYDPLTNCAFITGGTGINAGVGAYHPDGANLTSAKCGAVGNGSVMGIGSVVVNPAAATPTALVVYAQPNENRLSSFVSAQIFGAPTLFTTSSTCKSAWSLDARNVGGAPLVVAYCAESTDVEVYTATTSGALTLKGSVHLNGLTAQSALAANTGGWDVVLLDSGFTGILSRFDHILVVVDAGGATVHEVSRISGSTIPAVTGKLARMFRKGGLVEVESATDTGSSYDTYDLGVAIVKAHLALTADHLASGPASSSTGATIYTCGGTTCPAANNQ